VCCIWALADAASFHAGSGVTVTGDVVVVGKTRNAADAGNVVVWLTRLGEADRAGAREQTIRTPAPESRHPRIVQQNKRFDPNLLVVRVGSIVDFPNLDPFFHNVFSLFDGKRFDLGLYEAGSSRSVTFSKPGVCYIFCNIHPDMSAVVVSVDTPYFGVSNRTGAVLIPDVPAGRYDLSVWHERHRPERASDYPREIAISQTNASIGIVRLQESTAVITPHKHKYGKDYAPPHPTSPIYK